MDFAELSNQSRQWEKVIICLVSPLISSLAFTSRDSHFLHLSFVADTASKGPNGSGLKARGQKQAHPKSCQHLRHVLPQMICLSPPLYHCNWALGIFRWRDLILDVKRLLTKNCLCFKYYKMVIKCSIFSPNVMECVSKYFQTNFALKWAKLVVCSDR